MLRRRGCIECQGTSYCNGGALAILFDSPVAAMGLTGISLASPPSLPTGMIWFLMDSAPPTAPGRYPNGSNDGNTTKL